MAFSRWRQHNPGYCYLRPREPLRNEIARLCASLDLDDAYSFADADVPDDPEIRWFDLSAPWEPPQGT